MSIDNATPADWDAVRVKYIDSIVDKVDDDTAWVDNVRPDMVEKPPHYNQGGVECIDYIKQQLGECFIEYCEGNVIKYLHRWRYKNGIEDLKKAQWYLEAMVDKLVEVDK